MKRGGACMSYCENWARSTASCAADCVIVIVGPHPLPIVAAASASPRLADAAGAATAVHRPERSGGVWAVPVGAVSTSDTASTFSNCAISLGMTTLLRADRIVYAETWEAP
jgi:hypothetical protein